MAPLSGEWLEALKGEFRKPYYRALFQKVGEEYQTRKIFPPADDIFNAFHFLQNRLKWLYAKWLLLKIKVIDYE